MANPNIVSVTNIYGKTVGAALTTSSADILTNSASSGKVFKVNSVYVSNVDGNINATVNVLFYDNSTTSSFYLANLIVVPAASTLVIVSKDSFIYLEEGDKIAALAGSADDLQIIISYEEIS
jgi:hypothetical protein